MEFIAGLIAWLLFMIPVCIALSAKRRSEEAARAAPREESEDERAEKVRDIIHAARLSLSEQKAGGFGPWLTSVMYRAKPDAKVALTAVRWTLEELAGSRYDLSELVWAEQELMGMAG